MMSLSAGFMLLVGGFMAGGSIGFLGCAALASGRRLVEDDLLAALTELRQHTAFNAPYQSREEFAAMLARADLAISYAVEGP